MGLRKRKFDDYSLNVWDYEHAFKNLDKAPVLAFLEKESSLLKQPLVRKIFEDLDLKLSRDGRCLKILDSTSMN